jgi:hypothetical protein
MGKWQRRWRKKQEGGWETKPADGSNEMIERGFER